MITLADYSGDPYVYTLDPATGVYARQRVPRAGNRTGQSGYASEERLNDPAMGRDKILVGIYTDGERLLFSIHDRVFVLSEPGTRVEKVKPGLFSRRVSIVQQSRVLFDARFSWSWQEMSTWPSDGDIFDYAQDCVSSREKIFRSIHVWHAVHEGRSILGPGFQAEADSYVAERLAAERR